VLGKIKQLERREMADLIIVDAPATGHAITFLTSASGLLAAARSGPIRAQAQEVVDFLSDSERCRVMLVTIPEEMPVSETIEAAFQLEDRVGVTLGQVIVNECLAPLPPIDTLGEANRADFIKSLQKRYDMPPPVHKTVVPSSDVVEAMFNAAVFHESRRMQHLEQFRKLEDELPLPRLELPYLFSPVQGLEELGLLADALIRGVERLPASYGESSSREDDVSGRLDPRQVSNGGVSSRTGSGKRSQIADTPPGGSISGKSISGKSVDDLMSDRSVLICCGSGGVGKTTTSASLALYGAMKGRKVCVVTIDPAKRLANALGIDTLSNTPVRVTLKSLKVPSKGELWAMMLDPKATFDDLVNRYAPNSQQAERIMKNRIYRELTSALSGTQEYMAMEKLYELLEDGGYDLVVVDTPPTRNAIDFLEAPTRLVHFLEHRLFRILLMPTRMYLKAVSVATQALLRTISKVAGTEMVEDAIAFFQAFEGMEEGFRNRAEKMSVLIREPSTGFVLVTTPREDAVTEADWFSRRLKEMGIDTDALIVNRVLPDFDTAGKPLLAPEDVPSVKAVPVIWTSEERLNVNYGGSYRGADDPDSLFDVFMRNLLIHKIVSANELSTYADLASHLTGEGSGIDESQTEAAARRSVCTVVKVPLMAEDVHDVRGLMDMVSMIARA
jgi:anion-transporting  ArsA/GET3 family ATPase